MEDSATPSLRARAAALLAVVLQAVRKLQPGQCRTKRDYLRTWAYVTLILIAMHHGFEALKGPSEMLQGIENQAIDTLMRFGLNQRSTRTGEPAPIEIFEIDDATHRGWGAPLQTPRDKVVALIRRARQSGANVIVVDLDLSQPSCGPESGALSAADRALGEYLQQLNDDPSPSTPLVVIPRGLRQPLDADGRIDRDAPYQLVPSFLDPFVEEPKRVLWASTLFEVDTDRMVRRWRLAEIYCDPARGTQVIPSVQLLAALAQESANPVSQAAGQVEDNAGIASPAVGAKAAAQLAGRLQKLVADKSCSDVTGEPSLRTYLARNGAAGKANSDTAPTLGPRGQALNLAAAGTPERVVYRIVPHRQATHNRTIFTRSASNVLERTEPWRDTAGGIVIIANTSEGSGDFHYVPVSTLPVPGGYVLANAIDTLLLYGQFAAPPWVVSWLTMALAAAVLLLIYRALPFFLAKLVAFGAVLVVLFLLSVIAFGQGVGIAYVMPVFALQILMTVVKKIANAIDHWLRTHHEEAAPPAVV